MNILQRAVYFQMIFFHLLTSWLLGGKNELILTDFCVGIETVLFSLSKTRPSVFINPLNS